MDVSGVLADLVDEQRSLDAIVAPLTSDQWALLTPSPRWAISDQIGHLTYFDASAALAITDPVEFARTRDVLVAAFSDDIAVDDATLGDFRELDAVHQLDRWREARSSLELAASRLSDDDRVEWYGPSMGAKSFLTARLMEVWAHGQDIVDTVGAERPPTDRLRHIAQLGVITRNWSYLVRGDQPPDADIRVELVAPSGDTWSWGPSAADDQIIGSGEGFCLVVTQRRHVDDTDLEIRGDAARDWMVKAQAFAGSPTTGPTPRGAH